MVQDCLISHVGITRTFEDSPRVFRFNVSRAEDVVGRIGLTRFPQREMGQVADSPSSSSLLAFSEYVLRAVLHFFSSYCDTVVLSMTN